jgi:hypothetical protein
MMTVDMQSVMYANINRVTCQKIFELKSVNITEFFVLFIFKYSVFL